MTEPSDILYYKVPLRVVRRGVAKGHIIVTNTGRDHHVIYTCQTKKTCPENKTISHLTGTFLGVLAIDSSTFYTVLALDGCAHDRDLLLYGY